MAFSRPTLRLCECYLNMNTTIKHRAIATNSLELVIATQTNYCIRQSEFFLAAQIMELHGAFFRRDVRVVEGARLESVYTSKAYPGFESPSLRLRPTKL